MTMLQQNLMVSPLHILKTREKDNKILMVQAYEPVA